MLRLKPLECNVSRLNKDGTQNNSPIVDDDTKGLDFNLKLPKWVALTMTIKNSDTPIIDNDLDNDNKTTGKAENHTDLTNPRYHSDTMDYLCWRRLNLETLMNKVSSAIPYEEDNSKEIDNRKCYTEPDNYPEIGEVLIGTCPLTCKNFYLDESYCIKLDNGEYVPKEDAILDDDGSFLDYRDVTLTSKYQDFLEAREAWANYIMDNFSGDFRKAISWVHWCEKEDFKPWHFPRIKDISDQVNSILVKDGVVDTKHERRAEGKTFGQESKPVQIELDDWKKCSAGTKIDWVTGILKGGETPDDANLLKTTPVRRNLLTGKIEIHGEYVPLSLAKIQFAKRHGVKPPDFEDIVREMALHHEYHPVATLLAKSLLKFKTEAYFHKLKQETDSRAKDFSKTLEQIIIDFRLENPRQKSFAHRDMFPLQESKLDSVEEFITNVWGVTDPLDIQYIRHMALSAVARAFDPGCKVDTVTIFLSRQGNCKSSSFVALAFGKYSKDIQVSDFTNKDSLMVANSTWILEHPEIEQLTGRKGASEVKAYFTKQTDSYRKPYAEDISENPRLRIEVGTTNEEDIFLDSNNRRFNVVRIPDEHTIDDKYIIENRDEFWALITEEYLSGARWWWYEDEPQAVLRKKRNRQYMITSALSEEALQSVPNNIKYVTDTMLARIIKGYLPGEDHYYTCSISSKEAYEAKNILVKSGWEKQSGKTVRLFDNKRSTKAYLNPDYLTDEERTKNRLENNKRLVKENS